MCRCLPGLHAFTWCDSVCAFSGKGKLTALKLARQNPSIQELLERVCLAWEVSEELFMELQQFTCTMYAPNSGTDDVNLLRYRLFCAKKGDIDSRLLPPCQDTLRKHCQRGNYQAAVWRRSLQNSPVLPSPIGNGWFMKGECLALDWMSGCPGTPVLSMQQIVPATELHLPRQRIEMHRFVQVAGLCKPGRGGHRGRYTPEEDSDGETE